MITKNKPKPVSIAIKAYITGPESIEVHNIRNLGSTKEPLYKVTDDRTPILRLCRILNEDGYNLGFHLEVYRKGTKALVVNNIAKAAQLTVIENASKGPSFGPYQEFPKEALKAVPKVTRKKVKN